MYSLQLGAVMLLYINQQLNVILYTYSLKRNSNQSLELKTPVLEKMTSRTSSPSCKHRASEPQRNKHFSAGIRACCITACEVRDPDVPIDNQKVITGQLVLTIPIRTTLRHRFGLKKAFSVNCIGNQWQPKVGAGKSRILEKRLSVLCTASKNEKKKFLTMLYFGMG